MIPSASPRRARTLALALMGIVPLLHGLLALALGQDANWDLRNYHWYNAYAFLNGRHGFDLLPSQTPFFYNPTLDVPFFLLANTVPARLAGFALGTVQGLNFVPLFALAHALLRPGSPAPASRVVMAAALALAGLLGGGTLGLAGTTFYDNVASLGVTGSLLLVTVWWRPLVAGLTGAAVLRAFLAGLPVGAAMGLKQPSVVFCLGLTAALAFTAGPPGRRLALTVFFGLGVAAAVLAFSGHWMLYLWQAYGNPLFPYMNHLFHSPFAVLSDYRHKDFIPDSLVERLFFPLSFATAPLKVGEAPFRDLRIPVLYALLPMAVVAAWVAGRRGIRPEPLSDPGPTRYLLAAVALGYAAWAWIFCIYRYLVPLEMLAPIAIVLAVGLLPLKRRRRLGVALGLLAALQVTVRPADWGRVPWGRRFVEVSVPAIPDADRTMVLMAGYQPISHVIPAFPPHIPFIRIQSNFVQADSPDNGFAAVLRRRVAAHDGPFYLLSTIPDTAEAARAAAKVDLALDRGGCRTVVDNLGEPLALCRVHRNDDLEYPS